MNKEHWIVGGYRYHDTKQLANQDIKKKGDIVDYEAGLGWYVYNIHEYDNNPRMKHFGF